MRVCVHTEYVCSTRLEQKMAPSAMDAMVAVVMRFPFAKCLSLLESLQLAVVSDGLHPFLLEKYLVTRISLQTECVQTRRDDVALGRLASVCLNL